LRVYPKGKEPGFCRNVVSGDDAGPEQLLAVGEPAQASGVQVSDGTRPKLNEALVEVVHGGAGYWQPVEVRLLTLGEKCTLFQGGHLEVAVPRPNPRGSAFADAARLGGHGALGDAGDDDSPAVDVFLLNR